MLAAMLTAEGGLAGVALEDPAPFVGQALAGKMDITIPGMQLAFEATAARRRRRPAGAASPTAVLLDVTIRDETAPIYVKAAAQTQGHAAGIGYSEKHRHYAQHYDARRYTLFPIALETHGYLHPDSAAFFRSVSLYQHQRSGGNWPVSRCMARWRQLLSITLQRVVAQSMARNLGRSTTPAAAGGEQADPSLVDGYLRVRLLTPPLNDDIYM
jgi:hypothetical protein